MLFRSVNAKYAACGLAYTIIIDQQDNIWSFGWNVHGQLGLGDNIKRFSPTQIAEVKAKFAACGGSHTLLIDPQNNVLSFGYNNNGQLGLGFGYGTNRLIPAQIPLPEGVKAKYIACGYSHSIIIDQENNAWSFGYNNNGQLGLGDAISRKIPTLIPLPEGLKAKYVACGRNYSIIIDQHDNIWSFGDNELGQLGFAKYGYQDYWSGTDRYSPIQTPGLKAKFAACGDSHTIVLGSIEN